MHRSWIVFAALLSLISFIVWAQSQPQRRQEQKMSDTKSWNNLSGAERHVIENCGTEPAFSGEFVNHKADGTYTCARCNTPLFASDTKFDSRSGWPSFDNSLEGAVRELPDEDGNRVEIRCAKCDGHLGHVFRGERFTENNTRHCVNSLSLNFSAEGTTPKLAEAFFAGGCFWGVEHLLAQVSGVKDVVSGYMNGQGEDPSYEAVCTGRTGHAEAVRVSYDPAKVEYKTLAKLFFEIHDPTQLNRQGPDMGSQYRSGVYVKTKEEMGIVNELIATLKAKGLKVVTEVAKAGPFYAAEDYHQDYYARTGKAPYCHAHTPRFE
jgi:peptide methionine sulfoxide reductase msrA/msrB